VLKGGVRVELKYKPEDYSITDTGFYSLNDEDIENYKEKLVKCRKPHKCASCEEEIQVGNYAIRETGFIDREPVSSYTCTNCMDRWLDKISDDEE